MKIKNIAVVILVFSLLISCGKKTDNKGIDLNLEILPKVVTDFLFVKMNYKYNFTEKFSELDRNYKIFVHFWRVKNKEMLFQDDHIPITNPDQWKKGQSINYSREIFIPKFIYEFDIDFEGYEKIKLTVGLYNPKEKDNSIILLERILNVQSASLNAPEVIYDEGWHQPETDLKIKYKQEGRWRWTTKKAVCIIENPKKDSIIRIYGRVDKNKIKDQKVTLKMNDKVLEEFIPAESTFERQFLISPEQLGNEDEFTFVIETDKTFIPSALDAKIKDDRELGIQIFLFYFREQIK